MIAKPLVIFHASCQDGFCAAWLMRLAFPLAEFHAAQYGTDPPDVCGKKVYIVDFSYKRDVMFQIIGQAHSVCVLDHHRTAQEELKNFLGCTPAEFESPDGRLCIVFDMTKSGGRLAWEYLWDAGLIPSDFHWNRGYFRDIPPWLVDFTEDRDLWLWKLPDSREINATLASRPLSFFAWDYVHYHGCTNAGWQELLTEGRAILRYQQKIVADHVSHAREIDLDGHRVLAVNATTLISEIAGELASGRAFGVCWFQNESGKFVYSLRSQDGWLDVSEVAKRHGGGGHVRASGYTADAPPTFLTDRQPQA